MDRSLSFHTSCEPFLCLVQTINLFFIVSIHIHFYVF
jgi:hypothetical protein